MGSTATVAATAAVTRSVGVPVGVVRATSIPAALRSGTSGEATVAWTVGNEAVGMAVALTSAVSLTSAVALTSTVACAVAWVGGDTGVSVTSGPTTPVGVTVGSREAAIGTSVVGTVSVAGLTSGANVAVGGVISGVNVGSTVGVGRDNPGSTWMLWVMKTAINPARSMIRNAYLLKSYRQMDRGVRLRAMS